jgi:hypothetical protein
MALLPIQDASEAVNELRRALTDLGMPGPTRFNQFSLLAPCASATTSAMPIFSARRQRIDA